MASMCPGSQAKSKKVPKAGQQQLERAESVPQYPPGDKWEGHRLLVWVTTGGSVKLGVWITIAMCPGEHVASHTKVCIAWHRSGPRR